MFHDSPPLPATPGSAVPASMLAKIRTQSEPVPKPAMAPAAAAAAEPDVDHGKIKSANYRKEYAKLAALLIPVVLHIITTYTNLIGGESFALLRTDFMMLVSWLRTQTCSPCRKARLMWLGCMSAVHEQLALAVL